MDETTLLLFGETRRCHDCDAETIHVPVDADRPEVTAWCCTACDAAVVVLVAA